MTNFRSIANSLYKKKANWISGTGRYAVLSRCYYLTVSLHETREQAEESKRAIDEYACGHNCSKRHEIVDLAEKMESTRSGR